MKHVPKISSTHFAPKQTPNLQSPLKTSCPPPKFHFCPFSKWIIPFWCVSAYLSRARNLLNFQRVNLQQAEAPPFRFTGPQTSCTEVETKNLWKSDQTNNKHFNSINVFLQNEGFPAKKWWVFVGKKQKSHVMSWPPTISSPPRGSPRGPATNPHLEETSCCHAGCLHRLDARIQVAHPQWLLDPSLRLDFLGSTNYPSLRNPGINMNWTGAILLYIFIFYLNVSGKFV